MITFLDGILAENLPGRLVINIGGIGYEILVPLSTSDCAPAVGENVRILTHLHIREQEQTLYGFQTHDERNLFRLLIDRVSGIGPKLGLAVLSAMAVGEFKDAVIRGDITALSTISGLGKKTAERLIVEMRDRLDNLPKLTISHENNKARVYTAPADEAVSALTSLGYKPSEASRYVLAIAEDNMSSEELIRKALKHSVKK